MTRRSLPHCGFPALFYYPVSIIRPAIPIQSKQPALRVCAPGAHHDRVTPPDNHDVVHSAAACVSEILPNQLRNSWPGIIQFICTHRSEPGELIGRTRRS
jgi:hypothetical protein